jgi:hypothetical protein
VPLRDRRKRRHTFALFGRHAFARFEGQSARNHRLPKRRRKRVSGLGIHRQWNDDHRGGQRWRHIIHGGCAVGRANPRQLPLRDEPGCIGPLAAAQDEPKRASSVYRGFLRRARPRRGHRRVTRSPLLLRSLDRKNGPAISARRRLFLWRPVAADLRSGDRNRAVRLLGERYHLCRGRNDDDASSGQHRQSRGRYFRCARRTDRRNAAKTGRSRAGFRPCSFSRVRTGSRAAAFTHSKISWRTNSRDWALLH